jgi:hypothetical protein
MKDGPVRRTLKALARWNYSLNLAVTRSLRRRRGEPYYRLGGECRRCAACCEAPALQVNVLVWYLPRLRRLFLWWQERVNGFILVSGDPRQRAFVFKCTHFDWATRSCDSYSSRPGFCRDYPRALLDQPRPELLPGCGYRPVARNARRFLRVLDAQDLTGEQAARLRKELFLE